MFSLIQCCLKTMLKLLILSIHKKHILYLQDVTQLTQHYKTTEPMY